MPVRKSRVLATAVLVTNLLSLQCATSPFDRIASQFQYPVPFEPGAVETSPGNRIEILELLGTRPRIEVGGEYLLIGRYHLEGYDQGALFFEETAANTENGIGHEGDLQHADVRRGDGDFVLHHAYLFPGWFHVSLYGGKDDDNSVRVFNLYFGAGDTLLREKWPDAQRTP